MSLNTQKIRNPEIKRWTNDHLDKTCRMIDLGVPIAADTNYIVEVADMKVGAYVLAHQPDVCRRLSVTHVTVVVGTDTLGTLAFVGTDYDGYAISESVVPVADSAVYTTKAYKTVTSITGAGWVTAGGADTIIIGVDARLGLPYDISGSLSVLLGIVGTAIIAPTSYAGGTKEKSMVDISSGTFDGSKAVFALMVE